MARFTSTQGRYLSFIQTYTSLHGCPPAEAEIAAALCVSPPSVNQMVKKLEKNGLLLRRPGVPRSLRVLVPEDEIPSWRGDRGNNIQHDRGEAVGREAAVPAPSAGALYVFKVFLIDGPVSGKFANKECSRAIEIRGDQTLGKLHEAIFDAYDRWDSHLYEFQLGRRPFDPQGPNYGIRGRRRRGGSAGANDAETTSLDSLELEAGRTFGYWFDFGDGWYHQVQLERIDEAIPTVTYPRVIRRVGKSPPQYSER